MKASEGNQDPNFSRGDDGSVESEAHAQGAEKNSRRDEPISRGDIGKSQKQGFNNKSGRRFIQHQPQR